jgi:8-oxo-dGTP pyrophosphatase MutT (NUDIX family)
MGITMLVLTVLASMTLRRTAKAFTSIHRVQIARPPRASATSTLFMSANIRSASTAITTPISSSDEKLVQDMLYRIRQCNNMPDDIRATLISFEVDGKLCGKIRPNMAERLCSIKTADDGAEVFKMCQSSNGAKILTLSEAAGTTLESRTEAVSHVTNALKSQGIVTGWRDELFPVSDSFYNPPLFLIERAAANCLGILEYGVHINGLLKTMPQDNRQSKSGVVMDPPPLMWMGRRSGDKSKFPGMLDHIVAGGQPAGLSLLENVIKECEEEAGIPAYIATPNIHATGVISYENYEPKRDKISRVVLFNYDLYLPKDFVPKPVDGEVEEFFLRSIDQIKESMAPDFPDPIKPNCYIVIIDYLLRLGYISPEIPGYLDVVRELRSGDCR